MNKDPLLVMLGKVIASHRKMLGLSQEALGDALGKHRTYIGSVERGETNITLMNLIRVADALNTPVWTLLAEADVRLKMPDPEIKISSRQSEA